MLSFRSQTKLTPEDASSVASEGMLGKRHPASAPDKDQKKRKLVTRLRSGNNNFFHSPRHM